MVMLLQAALLVTSNFHRHRQVHMPSAFCTQHRGTDPSQSNDSHYVYDFLIGVSWLHHAVACCTP